MDVSFQLYSARNFTPWDSVLDHLAGLGYTQVEGFGGVYADAPAFRAALDARGLSMPSGHFFPLASFEADFDKTITAARALGMTQLYCPAPDESYRKDADAGAWRDLAARLETVAKRVQDAGLRFGWHNHHWEFMALPTGEIPMQILLDGAPSMEWEADIAWIVRGGADPLAWIAANAARITAAHVKDIAPAGQATDEDGWADVGTGVMDWPAITRALRAAGVSLFVMEHDNPSDLARFASRSITNFRTF
jgi:sugar phosphate isomerase/epimerase